jgi:alpha-L-arabinofuranosidase
VGQSLHCYFNVFWDGEYLLVLTGPFHFSAIRLFETERDAGGCGGDRLEPTRCTHPWLDEIIGPYTAPERPGFFDGRINGSSLRHNSNLWGVDDDQAPIFAPIAMLYGFHRQADGSYAEPFYLAFDDANDAIILPFGLTFRPNNDGTLTAAFAADDPSDTDWVDVDGDGTGDVESRFDVFTLDITPGQDTILGDYEVGVPPTRGTSFPSTLVDFGRTGIEGIYGTQGNPHLFYLGGGAIHSVWTDDEHDDKDSDPGNDSDYGDLSAYVLTGGSFPDGSWTKIVLPSQVNGGGRQIQPFFDGDGLYFTQDVDILHAAYSGGPDAADLGDDANWSAPVSILEKDTVYELERIIGIGEPTLALIDGVEHLFFIYVRVRDFDATSGQPDLDLQVGFVPRRPSPPPPPDVVITLDPTSAGAPIAPALFGINVPWNSQGEGILTGAELVADRSFATLGGTTYGCDDSSTTPAWEEGGSAGAVGAATFVATGGDTAPTGAPADPGHLLLGNTVNGESEYVSQTLLHGVRAGRWLVYFSSFSEDASVPAVFASLYDTMTFSELAPSQYAATIETAWTRHALTFDVAAGTDRALLVVGMVGTGNVRLDEVHLVPEDANVTVDPLIEDALVDLGVQSIRWPGGTVLDTFDWRRSIGPLLDRTENTDIYGKPETPSLGLDEVLQLCERRGIEPVIGINVLDPPASAAALIEYVNGAGTTTQGAQRVANGHAAPYGVELWEAGNEPSGDYGSSCTDADAGTKYAALAAPVIAAATNADPSIRVSAVAEANFVQADWVSTVPIPANWNEQVLGSVTGHSLVHGHFYSYHGYHPTEQERFEHIVAGGSILRDTVGDISAQSGGLPMMITEYHVLLTDGDIETNHLVDSQSALGVADLLMTLVDLELPAAHLFNLSEAVGFGALRRDSLGWSLRPAGRAFRMLSAFGGEQRLQPTTSAVPAVTVAGGTGIVPTDASYPMVTAVASLQPNGRPRVALLNRSYDRTLTVRLDVPGLSAGVASVSRLGTGPLAADNEIDATTVAVEGGLERSRGSVQLDLPPHSLTRIDL